MMVILAKKFIGVASPVGILWGELNLGMRECKNIFFAKMRKIKNLNLKKKSQDKMRFKNFFKKLQLKLPGKLQLFAKFVNLQEISQEKQTVSKSKNPKNDGNLHF